MLGVGRGGPVGELTAPPADGGAAGPPTSTPPAAARSEPSLRGGDGPGRAGPRRPAATSVAPVSGGGRRVSEREAWVVLASIDGLGPVSFGALLRAHGSARRVLEVAARRGGAGRLVAGAAAEDLRLAPEVAAAVVRAGHGSRALLARLASAGVEPITAEDDGYPPRLRGIEMPPPVLFVTGDAAALAAVRAVAVVGTRRPTDDGRSTASRIAAVLAAAGATVVSGLAVGIDGAAHAGALLAEGATVAVLGSGHARLYPPAHAHLAREIVRTGGAVVAEVPPDADPRPASFPRRNRIIAALADATVVVEAGERSGALITASWALEQGRSLFAVPGPLGRPQSAGCNRLLRAHPGEVRIVAGMDELLEDLGYGIPLAVRRRRLERSESPLPDAGAVLARLGPAEAAVARRLIEGPATADSLAGAADLQAATVLAVLTRLEEEGLVVGAFGRYRLAGALGGLRSVPAGRRDRLPAGASHR